MTTFCVIPPSGMCPLEDKLVPLCERSLKEGEAMAYTRAEVDVSAFKNFLLDSNPEIWEDAYHAKENVALTRPAHDAWGIKKIVFTFCDDFMLKVLDLPFSQSEEWRQHLLPIYEAIGVPEHRIIRSLLASMPPGVDIPVHHDTGLWVKHTHRVHVAIYTDVDKVHFQVGHTDDTVNKYSFEEGRIVELNNQAKHAVQNTWDKHRIHLIFDYVDEGYPLERFVVEKGEEVFQTRRSIDLKRHVGSRPAPSFIIIGVQKCGTTSMYEYLCNHPLVQKGSRRETHYYDWRWDKEIDDDDNEKHLEAYLTFYNTKLREHSSMMTGESTPSYLLHSDLVIPRLKRVCPWLPKLIVMLRNPVDRAFSQYQMSIDMAGNAEQIKNRGQSAFIKKSFEEIVKEEIQEIQNMGISDSTEWKEFQNKCLKGLPMGHGGHSIVARGLYALQLEAWYAEYPHDKIVVMSIGDIKGSSTQSTMDKVYNYVGLPPHVLTDTSAQNTRTAKSVMETNAREMLSEFYAPFNEKLFSMAGKRFDENW